MRTACGSCRLWRAVVLASLGALTARGQALDIVTATLPPGTAGVSYAFALSATNGSPPYTWSYCTTGRLAYAESASPNSYAAGGTARGWQADDQTWLLQLPFSFTIFNQTYSFCYVDSNGRIVFSTAASSPDATLANFKTNCMIAVLWGDLYTTTGNIYVETNATSVLVRWNARYWADGSPVNASATLTPDGTIRLRYGPGNVNGGFVGISAGDGTYWLVSSRSESGSLSNAQDVLIVPFPLGSPLPDGLAMAANGVIQGVPAAPCSNDVNFAVADAAGGVTNRWLPLVIAANPNQPPMITSRVPSSAQVSVPESASTNFAVFAFDPEGSNLTYSWTWGGNPTGANSSSFTLNTTWGDAQTRTLRVTVSDGTWFTSASWTVTILSDNDGDGLPNGWELLYPSALDPWDPSDAVEDPDGDFLTNYQEFRAGTDPTKADTDGDSLGDGWEVEFGPNPTNAAGGIAGSDLLYRGANTALVAIAVDVVSNLAYVAAGAGGLYVVDVTTPSNAAVCGALDTDGFAYDVWTVGGTVYLADGTNGLVVVAVTNPVDPTPLATVDTRGDARGVSAVSNLACVADETNGLVVVDVSTPSAPAALGTNDTAGSALGVFAAGTTAYVADGTNGLRVVNLADPANPLEIGHYVSGGYARRVHVNPGRAALADGDVQVVSVTNPAAPVLLGTVLTPGLAAGAQISSDLLFVADGSDGVAVYDISNPAAAVLVVASNTPGLAGDVCVVSSRVYVADGNGGLRIYDYAVRDTDQDGLGDAWEMAFFGSLIHDADGDMDGDGISNWGEYLAGMNPTNADQNGDGVTDGIEVQNLQDPRQIRMRIATTNLPEAVEMVPYSAALAATNGTAPITWFVPYRVGFSNNTYALTGSALGLVATGQCGAEVALPFPFPFYGVAYTSVYVANNGAVGFTNYPWWPGGNPTNALRGRRMIAALWELHTTTGTLNAVEDVYVASSTGACILCWKAERNRTAVNASMTLCPDGTIRLAYGMGNTNGGIIGISAGDGTNFYYSPRSYRNQDRVLDIVFRPPLPLPEGLSLTVTGGVLSGTATTAGTNDVFVGARDQVGQYAERLLQLVVRTNANRRPQFTWLSPSAALVQVPEESNQVFAFTAVDPEGSNVTSTWRWGDEQVAANTGQYILVTHWGDATSATLRVTLSDGFWTNVWTNWNVTILSDNDGDGMPNWWERLYEGLLNPWDPNDATNDADGDRFIARDEYGAGTSPTDSNDFLGVTEFARTADRTNLTIRWRSVSNKFYHVRRVTNLVSAAGEWVGVNVPATPPLNTLTTPAVHLRSGVYWIQVSP